MRTCDLSPLGRSTVGFDHLLDLVNGSLLRISLARVMPEALKPHRIAIAIPGNNDEAAERRNAA